MSNIFFSIIIPVYNVEKYIYHCLESLFDQDLRLELYEIIIVNDGTPDNSIEIVNQFRKKYSNITILNQQNQGVSSARNNGIALAKGKYIIFVDPDDLIIKNSLKTIYYELNEFENELLILNSITSKNNKDQSRTDLFPFPIKYSGQNFNGLELFKYYNRGSVWGVVYSRDFIDKNKILFDNKLKNGEDALFFSMCLIYTQSIKHLDIDFYQLCEREGSASKSWDEERLMLLAKGVSQIDNILKSREFSIYQSAILYSLAFRFISHLIFRFFEQKDIRISDFKKLKRECITSGMYPIKLEYIPKQINKIRILNLSFDIFGFLLFIRRSNLKFLYRN